VLLARTLLCVEQGDCSRGQLLSSARRVRRSSKSELRSEMLLRHHWKPPTLQSAQRAAAKVSKVSASQAMSFCFSAYLSEYRQLSKQRKVTSECLILTSSKILYVNHFTSFSRASFLSIHDIRRAEEIGLPSVAAALSDTNHLHRGYLLEFSCSLRLRHLSSVAN
jgi:hypothetical protein